eukprot:3401781-Karenia_brevis.AAC.1
MDEAGVDKESYSCTQGVDGAGRLAKTWFVNNTKLQEARMKVNALKKQTSTMPGKVWLDVSKTDAELQPRRPLFRGMEYLVN